MILNSYLPIKAWLNPQTSRLPGVRPITTKDWLAKSDTYDAQIAYRRALIASHRDVIFQSTPKSEAPCIELKELIFSEASLPSSEQDHPLLEAASHVQEDLCILQKEGDQHILTAAVMCFPSSWDVNQKIGRSLESIHQPVPEFSPVSSIVERMLSALRVEQPLARANFLIYTDPELHQPRGEGISKPIDANAPRYIRVERQTFRRLPKTKAVIFAIHTYIVAEHTLSSEEHLALAQFKPELLRAS